MAEPLTVRELIAELQKMPQGKRLEVQDIDNSADVMRVFDQGDVVVIECGEEYEEEAIEPEDQGQGDVLGLDDERGEP